MYRMKVERKVRGSLREVGREYDDAHEADLIRQGYAEKVSERRIPKSSPEDSE